METYTIKQYKEFKKVTGIDTSRPVFFNGNHLVERIEINSLFNSHHPYRHVAFYVKGERLVRHFDKLSNK